jgi:hypothetical protein
MELSDAIVAVQQFSKGDITARLAEIEQALLGATAGKCSDQLIACEATSDTLAAAGSIKRLVGQINVVIHALGILLCLPKLLHADEVIEYVSLGAGNTGKPFDLETNRRIAEFKFIRWQGGPESIRQNALFKDFYLMARYASPKRKFLYVLGVEYPTRFFNSGRSLSSVLSGHAALQQQFVAEFGQQYRTVSDYYTPRQHSVTIEDVSPLIPQLTEISS